MGKSENFSRQTWEKINEVILAVEKAEDFSTLRKVTLSRIKKIIDYDAASFDRAKVAEDKIIFYDPITVNIKKSFIKIYYSHFQFIDTMAFFFAQNEKTVYRTSDYISKGMRLASNYYNEWLKPQKLFNSLGASVGFKMKLFGSLNLWRNIKKCDFTKTEMKILEILNEHISNKFFELIKEDEIIRRKNRALISCLEKFNLSKREIEIASGLFEGKKNLKIAEELSITEDTVKKHSTHIYRKITVCSKPELIKKIHELL